MPHTMSPTSWHPQKTLTLDTIACGLNLGQGRAGQGWGHSEMATLLSHVNCLALVYVMVKP